MNALFDELLRSSWLLPALAALIALDGPLPMLPSETLLIVAISAAAAENDLPAISALMVTAVIGSVLGDGAVYSCGRWSHRFVGATDGTAGGVAAWVGRTVGSRPIVTCVGARMLPGGRLVSTAACGRLRLPLGVFVVASLASSALWSAYLLLVATALRPLTKGDPVLSTIAGLLLGVATAGVFALVQPILAPRMARGRTSSDRRSVDPVRVATRCAALPITDDSPAHAPCESRPATRSRDSL